MAIDQDPIEVHQIQQVTDTAIERLVDYGESMVVFSLKNPDVLMPLKTEVCKKSQLLNLARVFRPHGEEDGWENVYRATFFRPTHLRKASMYQKVASLALPSRLFMPKCHKTANIFSEHMRASAEKAYTIGLLPKSSSLMEWEPNRLGINWMDGSPEQPSLIQEHVDTPKEVGAVVVFDVFREGMATNSYISDRNVTVIFGKDTCDAAGVNQPKHSVASKLLRLSLTLAELKPSTR